MISNEKIAMFTEKELARELNISLPKLRKDRVKGIGFNYVKIGKSVRYPMYDVLKQLQELNALKFQVAIEKTKE